MGDESDFHLDRLDPDDEDEPDYVTCKYCGQKYLHWESASTKSARAFSLSTKPTLVDEDGNLHVCPRVDPRKVFTPIV